MKIKLSYNLVRKLYTLPESGMGYQNVTVTLKDGTILSNRKVINSTYLLLLDNEEITESDIENIEFEK